MEMSAGDVPLIDDITEQLQYITRLLLTISPEEEALNCLQVEAGGALQCFMGCVVPSLL